MFFIYISTLWGWNNNVKLWKLNLKNALLVYVLIEKAAWNFSLFLVEWSFSQTFLPKTDSFPLPKSDHSHTVLTKLHFAKKLFLFILYHFNFWKTISVSYLIVTQKYDIEI